MKWIKATYRLPEPAQQLPLLIKGNYDLGSLNPHTGQFNCTNLNNYSPEDVWWLQDGDDFTFNTEDMSECWDYCDRVHSELSGCGISDQHFKDFMKEKYNIDITQ